MIYTLKFTFVFLLLIAINQASAQNRGQAFGIGMASCGTWAGNPSLSPAIEAWILGFWTGSNTYSSNRLVGHSTDAHGVIEEVRRICLASPSTSLLLATNQVHSQMMKEGR